MHKKVIKKAVIILFIILALCFFCQFQNKHIVISYYDYGSSKIGDDLNGYRIVQISDLHNVTFGRNNQKLMEKIKKCSPDMIVITGDLVDSNHTDIESALEFVKEAVDIAPVYYVTGNHEYWIEETEYTRLLQGMNDVGVNDLNNNYVQIKRENSSFLLVGLDDNSLHDGTLDDMIRDRKELTVVLAHEPQYIQDYEDAKADLVLSGHAHGGQVRIPFVGGVVAPDQGFFPQYTSGEHICDKTEMIISRGLGNSIIPLRLFNYPEIVCVELHSL